MPKLWLDKGVRKYKKCDCDRRSQMTPENEWTRIWIKEKTLDAVRELATHLQRGSDTWDERIQWLLFELDTARAAYKED